MRGENTARAEQFEAPKLEIRRPIDMEHLSRHTMGDPGLQEEVLRLFDQMSHAYYERLEVSTSIDELLRNLHTLKGAAAGVGAFALAELARVAEAELRAGGPVNPERIDDLALAVQEVSAFIGDRLDAADAP